MGISKRLIEELVNGGKSTYEIACAISKSETTVHRLLAKFDLKKDTSLPRETLENLVFQGMSIREIGENLSKSPTSIRYWLAKYDLKTLHLRPHSPTPTICRLCEGFIRQYKNKRRTLCGTCSVRVQKYRLKTTAVRLLGDVCKKCGWSGNIAGFNFHHRSKDKSFDIRSATRGWDKVLAELKKCDLLCSRCHSIEHSGDRDSKFMEIVDNYKGKVYEPLDPSPLSFPKAPPLTHPEKDSELDRYLESPPEISRKILESLVKKRKSTHEIARILSKSQRTVCKLLAKFNLKTDISLPRKTLEDLVYQGMSIREIGEVLLKSPTSIRYWLEKYDLVTLKLPDPLPETCKLCNGPKNHQINGRLRSLCRNCKARIHRYRMKSTAVRIKGGKCQKCDWSGHLAGFDFHHHSGDKKFNIGSALDYAWEDTLEELKKCELLCGNCHSIEHAGDRGEKFMEIVNEYRGKIFEVCN